MTRQEANTYLNTHPQHFYFAGSPKVFEHRAGRPGRAEQLTPEERSALFRQRRERIDETGARIYQIPFENTWFLDADRYDFSIVDDILKDALEGHPKRWMLPRISLNAPVDWMREHPEELCVYWRGPKTAEEIRAMVGTPQQDMAGHGPSRKGETEYLEKISRQSFSSRIWVRDAGEALRQLIRHIESGPWSKQVIGYMIGFGNCGECMWWGDWRNQGDHRRGDFGISHRKRAYEWAVEKYGSLNALREAWSMPDLTEGNLPMPTPPERESESGLTFSQVLLTHDQRQVDMNEFHSEVTIEALEAFGKIIHDEADKPSGCFYGYLQDQNAGYAGHLAIERALNTPHLDFFSSPKAYHYALAGDPGGAQAPGQSFARKKLWIEEHDSRSHHAKTSYAPDTMEETRTIFWRELYRALTHNHSFWWMDQNYDGLTDDWFADDEIVAMLKQQTPFFEKWSKIPRKGTAEIVIVEDERSWLHQADCAGMQRSLRLRLPRELRLCGAPADHLRLADLMEMDLSRYKFIVFVHAFVMPPDLWEKLLARIRPDASILWNYGAALLDPQWNPNNQKYVTGFRVTPCDGRMQPPDLYKHIYWHAPRKIPQDYPLIEILPEEGQEILQTSPDGHILCAQIPRGEGGKSIFSADFTLRTPILREMLEQARVSLPAPMHCAVWADEKLIGFFPRYDVCFTHVFDGLWRDVLSGETVTGATGLSIRAKGLRIFEKI